MEFLSNARVKSGLYIVQRSLYSFRRILNLFNDIKLNNWTNKPTNKLFVKFEMTFQSNDFPKSTTFISH